MIRRINIFLFSFRPLTGMVLLRRIILFEKSSFRPLTGMVLLRRIILFEKSSFRPLTGMVRE